MIMDNKQLKIWIPFVFSLVLAGGMFLGYKLQDLNSSKYRPFSPSRSTKFDEIINYIEENYVDDVDKSRLYDESIASMLEHLDPHSVYIPATEIANVEEEMEGEFDGIGIEFFIVNDTIMVVTPISGGPSEQLGIQAGDKIIRINDSLVAGIGIQNADVVKKLKGPSGTKVKVTIQRNGQKNLLVYNIKRDKIPLYSVDAGFMVNKDVGYIKISRFAQTTYSEFMQKLASLKGQGMKSLILDLRENPGGYLEQATAILDEIIDGRKDLVITKGRSYPKMEYKSKIPGQFEAGKIAILIDEGSASASEIVAGAVQDWDRGVIIGRRSFGKGLVQDQYQLGDNSALRLTIAKYYTPSGRCIQKPYSEGLDNYNNEMLERVKHGEIFSKDSIKNDESEVFYTKIKKRKVYGGGGITPDIFIPLDTTNYNPFLSEAFGRGLVQEFAYNYYSSHKGDFQAYTKQTYKDNFKVSDALYQEFVQYAFSNQVPKEYNKFTSVSKTEVNKRLKAYIAKQIWKNEGFYPLILSDDKAVQAALKALQ